MFPLALAPYIPAAAAGIGAFAKGVQKYAPQIRGGIDTINRYANPIINKMFNTQMGVPIQNQVAPSAFGAITPTIAASYFDNPSQAITDAGYFSGADDASKLITGEGESGVIEDVYTAGAEIIDAILEDTKKEKEDKKDKKKKKETKETKENKEPSIDDLPLDVEEAKKKKNFKKGGHVKKQRKRKPYKSSGFVKMKKTKKRKYI